MAAAVEGTPRRVKVLLSSFLHTSGNEQESRGFEPEDSDVESLSRCQPRSKEAFWNRVETFSVSLRQNSTLVNRNENRTVFITDSKTCEQLNEALVSGHSKLCPWPDNPCPESFVRLPIYSYSQWLDDYRARWRSIVTLADDIPLVDEQAIKDMDGLSPGHIEGLQNLVDAGSLCWATSEVDLEQALKASCIIALCGWQGSSASDPEVKTLSCSLCRRELGVWNFFPLRHLPDQEDSTLNESVSYVDTGQMVWGERSAQQLTQQEESCVATGEEDEDRSAERADQAEPMEETSYQSDKISTQGTSMDISKSMKTSISVTVKPHEAVGLKSPLHRSLLDLPGEEATESLCVEVENESLSERLQEVETELEFLGSCNREGSMDREGDEPRPKKRKLQEIERNMFHVISEHRPWCPWVVSICSNDGTTSPAGWRLLLGTLLTSMSSTSSSLLHEVAYS
ncbi:PREDICTED: nuclear-interacting partner of ALK-like [Acropora digitifera]|uniref:nuclear-interacting partner of ALK-like n=1 Tax=Acropora digitifera TaxID=70779 RepID=UPI00077A220D|nr:PREDICTED: nuclear-interacting partner of ALK-like [Acropora digitifera]